jgi:hypothetical protein
MRRIEIMKTMNVHSAALDSTARRIGSTRPIGPEPRLVPVMDSGAAIERQLDEIQCTFGARWEW